PKKSHILPGVWQTSEDVERWYGYHTRPYRPDGDCHEKYLFRRYSRFGHYPRLCCGGSGPCTADRSWLARFWRSSGRRLDCTLAEVPKNLARRRGPMAVASRWAFSETRLDAGLSRSTIGWALAVFF